MANGGLYTKPQQQKPPSTTTTTQNKKNPSKFYSNFIFKAIIFILFLVIIPLFSSSESPDVVNNNNSSSIFSRWWWELLHLIFVGIVVSYGLFSRKNEENYATNNSKFDNAQSYMSRLLQVPSVFDDGDDEFDDVNSPIDINSNIKKVQTWSSQYYRNQPVLLVAKDGSLVDNNSNSSNNNSNNNRPICPTDVNSSSSSSMVGEKPLLLPVRSLKSRVYDENDGGLVNKVNSRGYARSNSSHSPRHFSSDSRRIGRNDVNLVDGEETMSRVSKGYARSNSSVSGKGLVSDSKRMSRNNSVLSRTEVNDEFVFGNGEGEVSRSLIKSSSSSSSKGFSSISRKSSSGDYGGLDEEVKSHEEKVENSVVLPSPIPWRSRSGMMEVNRESSDSSLHSLPPSLEESGAVQLLRSQSSLSSRSSSSSSSSPKELSPSPSLSSPKRLSPTLSLSSESLAKSAEDFGRRKVGYGLHLAPPPPPPPPPPPMHRSQSAKPSSIKDKEKIPSRHKELKRSVWSEPNGISRENSRLDSLNRVHSQPRNGMDNSSVGKSVRTIRAGETMSSRRTREIEEDEERSEDIDSDVTEKSERAGYNPISKQSFSEFPKETRDFLEQVLVETDDESGTEDENYVQERVDVEPAKTKEAPSDSVDEGPDVDKKADEFIAKFREQIRLQRIESIKRSTGQLKRSSIR